MDEMRNAIIEEFKKLDHDRKKAILTFMRKLVDIRESRRIEKNISST